MVNVFSVFSPLGRSFIWTNPLNPVCRMLCAKFGWNQLSDSGEDYFLNSLLYFSHLLIIFPWKRMWPFIWRNLNPLYPRMLWSKNGWNYPFVSGEKDFLILLMHFWYFVIISPWKRAWHFIWRNLNCLLQRMICAKFGWNWPFGSGEEDFKFC